MLRCDTARHDECVQHARVGVLPHALQHATHRLAVLAQQRVGDDAEVQWRGAAADAAASLHREAAAVCLRRGAWCHQGGE
eukprot:100017-Chlamydomonas_euryale.AAC.1